jgi:hypothetical protein
MPATNATVNAAVAHRIKSLSLEIRTAVSFGFWQPSRDDGAEKLTPIATLGQCAENMCGKLHSGLSDWELQSTTDETRPLHSSAQRKAMMSVIAIFRQQPLTVRGRLPGE